MAIIVGFVRAIGVQTDVALIADMEAVLEQKFSLIAKLEEKFSFISWLERKFNIKGVLKK